MTTDVLTAVVAVVASLLFGISCMVIAGSLILLHYVLHNRRVSEQNACFQKIRELQADNLYLKDRVHRMESLAVSTVMRLAELAKIVAIAAPDHSEKLRDMMDSLVKLFHEQAPQSGISIDANGDVTIGGDAVAHDKVRQVEYASGLGSAS